MTRFDLPGGADALAGFTTELVQLKAKADEVREFVRTASATTRSPDGAVTVTVGASGVLTNLAFGPRAYRRPPEALSSLVMQLIETAQKQVAKEMASEFGGLVGENSAAMEVVREFLPHDPEDGDDAGAADIETGSFVEPGRARSRSTTPPPLDEDDDFSNPW